VEDIYIYIYLWKVRQKWWKKTHFFQSISTTRIFFLFFFLLSFFFFNCWGNFHNENVNMQSDSNPCKISARVMVIITYYLILNINLDCGRYTYIWKVRQKWWKKTHFFQSISITRIFFFFFFFFFLFLNVVGAISTTRMRICSRILIHAKSTQD
jgi:fumarate reductase subunit C